MGLINELAKMQLDQISSVPHAGQSGTQKMVMDYKQKQSLHKSTKRIGSESGGICDDFVQYYADDICCNFIGIPIK